MPPTPQPTSPGALGALHRSRGEFALAEPLLRAAVAAAEQAEPCDALALAAALNSLGLLCKDVAQYDEARALYDRALALLQGAPATDPRDVAAVYHNLGGIEHARGNHAEGEAFARRGLAIREGIGGDQLAIAVDMVALAALLDGQGKDDEAERLYVEALRILEADAAANAGEIAVALNDLARAAALYAEALAICERSLGADHPRTITCRENAARCAAAGSDAAA